MRIIKNSGKMKIISMLKLKKWSLEGAKLMAVFSIDLPGRVKNFELPRTKPLMPLFETIVNSIYAIEERQQNDDKVNGYINIEIIREPQMRVQTEGIDSSINDITGFVVTDNGIGFDENNMKSFLQSDSTYRAEKGGKGVGRFAWLKAFKEADIESSFIDAGEWVRRKFCFTLEQNEINDSLEDIDPLTDNKTIVALKECLAPYKKNLPKRMRYYQGIIDNNIIDKREDYNKLKKRYVIFICDYDEFGMGRHIYTFENTCIQEPALKLNDDTVKIILNTKGTMDDVSDEVKELLHYIGGDKPSSTLTKLLDEEVNNVKSNKKWRREFMTLLMRDNENKLLGKYMHLIDQVKKLDVKDAEIAAKILGIKEQQIYEIKDYIAEHPEMDEDDLAEHIAYWLDLD